METTTIYDFNEDLRFNMSCDVKVTITSKAGVKLQSKNKLLVRLKVSFTTVQL